MTYSGSHRRAAHRAAVFDEVANLYAVARPAYPDTLVDDLVQLAGVDGSHRILEIGAGTGQLTVPLAKRGLSIVALERGANLARLLQRNLASFARTRIVRRLDPERRSGLLACIADLIERRFGGTVVRRDAYDMWIATTR